MPKKKPPSSAPTPVRRRTRRRRNPPSPPSPQNPLQHAEERLRDATTMMVDELMNRADTFISRMMDNFFRPLGQGPESEPGRWPGGGEDRDRTRQPPPPRTPPRQHADPPSPSLYDIMEISPKASPEVITAVWKSLCKRYHPDLGAGNAEKMKRINAAYSVLKDPVQRAAYDRHMGMGGYTR